MELSILLAKVIGFTWLFLFLGFFMNDSNLKTYLSIWSNKRSIMLGGLFSLIVGLFMVLTHNDWISRDFRLVITIIGWCALFKGIYLGLYPSEAVKRIEKIKAKDLQVYLFLVLFIALYLLYSAYNI